jgi:hypothetical protein
MLVNKSGGEKKFCGESFGFELDNRQVLDEFIPLVVVQIWGIPRLESTNSFSA